jgi:hypothetical protein
MEFLFSPRLARNHLSFLGRESFIRLLHHPGIQLRAKPREVIGVRGLRRHVS